MVWLTRGLVPNSITFERIPSDYAILKIVQPPEDAGGDTLWASGYEAYDRLSPALQKLAETLTATHYQPNFVHVKETFGEDLIDDYRGSPENYGLDFEAEQYVQPRFLYVVPLRLSPRATYHDC